MKPGIRVSHNERGYGVVIIPKFPFIPLEEECVYVRWDRAGPNSWVKATELKLLDAEVKI
jgi:hypothetical protein